MLSNVIHKHLDNLDKIDEEIKSRVDEIISSIDIKAIISDPHQELGLVIEEIYKIVIDEFQHPAHQDGLALANEIRKRDVKVDPSKDPTKNEDLLT